MIFEYAELKTATEHLEIDDIGNVALVGTDDILQEYYLIIQTILGRTTYIKYGPIIPDLPILPNKCDYNFLQFDYSEKRISKLIEKFLNEHVLTKAEIVAPDDIKPRIKNFIDYIGLQNEGN